MENLETTPFDDIILPTAWDIENNSPYVNIDSSGLKVNYTDPDDNKAAIIRANHPIHSKCGIFFYFEIKIINKGKNGMIGVGYCTKQNDKEIDDSNIKTDYINNMLMLGQESKKSELWSCGYHGDDGYSFYSGGSEPYGSTYTTGIACNLPDNWKVDELTKSLEKNQRSVFELSYRGKVYFIMGEYDKAFEDLTRLLEIKPDNIQH
ncbi:hypothetical protein C2G38_2039528 [Gigaspora rosea]|uniref:Uncharacterized protein n=1 Tax=Gigaspora rosea TaxID=44941 RepID=A0A397V7H9_9GLOM|nr:hypothetical protein C2G38_2039528 [Gigaspora rosea]